MVIEINLKSKVTVQTFIIFQKISIFQINDVILNFIFIKESLIHTNIQQHDCFQH